MAVSNKFLDEVLNENEKTEVLKFNENKTLKSAVEKVMLAVIYNNGTLRKDMAPDPTRNGALALAIMASNGHDISNEKLGEDLRSMAQAINLLEQGLAQLGEIKNEKEENTEEENPAV